MSELNRRLTLDDDIIYPITKAENVIHLQKEIKDKLPTVSETEPDIKVTGKVWLKPVEDIEETQEETNNIETLSLNGIKTLTPNNNDTLYETINDSSTFITAEQVETINNNDVNEYETLDNVNEEISFEDIKTYSTINI